MRSNSPGIEIIGTNLLDDLLERPFLLHVQLGNQGFLLFPNIGRYGSLHSDGVMKRFKEWMYTSKGRRRGKGKETEKGRRIISRRSEKVEMKRAKGPGSE